MRPTADKTVFVEVHPLRHFDLNGSDENIDPVRGHSSTRIKASLVKPTRSIINAASGVPL